MWLGEYCAKRRFPGLKSWLITLALYTILGVALIVQYGLNQGEIVVGLMLSLLLATAVALVPFTIFFALAFRQRLKSGALMLLPVAKSRTSEDR